MRALLNTAYSTAPLVLCACTLGWAGNTIASRLAVAEISPMLLIFLRWFFVITIMLSWKGRAMAAAWPQMRPRLGWVIIMGACGFSFFNGLFYVAAHTTTAVNLGIIQGLIPAMILLGSFFVFGTRIGAIQIAGVVLAFCGILVVVGGGSIASFYALRFNTGDILMLITCVFYSGFALGLKSRPDGDPLVLFGYMACAAFIISIPMVLAEHAFWGLTWPGIRGWLIIGFVTLWPSLLSQIFFMRGVELIGPGRAGLYANTIPVFAASLAVLLLGESLHPYHIVAMVLVFAGIYLFETTKKHRAANPRVEK